MGDGDTNIFLLTSSVSLSLLLVVLVGTMLCVYIGLDQLSIPVSFPRLVVARLMLLMFSKAPWESTPHVSRRRSAKRKNTSHRRAMSSRPHVPELYQDVVEPLPLPRTRHSQPPVSSATVITRHGARVSRSKLSMMEISGEGA